ncbi:hypothetical protein GUJ93_ZPchr0009g326 [Zizania palustris]|uniref:LIM zinc-binding domain-containing protein n=1 Tax=Zizania palustris TaxID=103762 RepID=A0A8J5RMU6_ZIZPA|nr:hypothetical protein GUJ93_ZPchr0009g326 [Zizania palustris]
MATSFQGMATKCTACDKTLYRVNKLTADIKIAYYNSFEGVLYCMPHFYQLFKRIGSLDKNFEGTPKVVRPERTIESENATAVSSAFAGIREKYVGCNKTVYQLRGY